ncbi:hypothetical protein CkaCkLH20_03393 [Colletotrichum karsti]|uniref:Calcineurin-like phosphoesterase domain-containing protein n=1 Tax=Colletotrichum karsti TaxID=1095194 RepID=A0A9P6IHL2_9PEZI|nr:uncharacterized protein CkaCkLH20_03393 [Colletotrichum karsti]KAF9879160.1 hypothetical protein CkaCkLH20_03393 [Colletotrichum karsti]
MPVQIQIVSDLHLEATKAYDYFAIPPKAPVLALLGDIGTPAKPHEPAFLHFLARQLAAFRAVLFVPGNHEAYRSSWPETLAILRAFETEVRAGAGAALGEFVLLDRGVFRVPGEDVVVLGCSLFSRVPPESREDVGFGLNDFFQTGDGWDVDAHNEAHKRDLEWLNARVGELEGSGVEIVVFTHWSPSRDGRAADPRHAGSAITSAFSTDLSGEVCFRSKDVKIWAFGHTHFNCDFTVEREDAPALRLLANQRGYYGEAGGFDVEKVIQL